MKESTISSTVIKFMTRLVLTLIQDPIGGLGYHGMLIEMS